MPLNDAKAVARAATVAWLEDSDQVDELLEMLAEGASLKTVCGGLGLIYATTMRWLAKNRPGDYEAAKIVRADTALDRIAELEQQLEDGEIGWNEFRELTKSKQWRVERLNPGRYSPRQSIDMQVTDKTRVHLEAIRQLARTVVVQPALPAPTTGVIAPALPAPVLDACFTVGPMVPTETQVIRDTQGTKDSLHSNHSDGVPVSPTSGLLGRVRSPVEGASSPALHSPLTSDPGVCSPALYHPLTSEAEVRSPVEWVVAP